MELTYIKSASIILQKTSGEVYLCKRNKHLRFFPNFWVFPGGKIDHPLPDDWIGTEAEVYDTIFQELYEEVGIVLGSTSTVQPDDRRGLYLDHQADPEVKQHIREQMIYVGKKNTPPFRRKLYSAAYYWLEGEDVDTMHPIVDGKELVEGRWIQPKDAIELWRKNVLQIPPPNLHILRNLLERDHFVMKTLVETDLDVGLQTKIEFRPGFQVVPITSSTINPFFNTNLIIVEDDTDILLVDPGANTEGSQHLREVLYSLPVTPKVFITHHHKDHWEGLSVVEDIFPDAVVKTHPDTAERIETNLVVTGVRQDNIRVGSKILKVIPTPGHTDSHLSLYDENENLLIAGDHVVGFGSAVLDPHYGSMSQYFQTTRHLIDISPQIILPAHGPPHFDGISLLQQYINHRTDREDAILAAINDGKHSLDEIVETVYQDVPQDMWEYAKRNIQLHIEKLREEDRLPPSLDGSG